MKNQHLNHYVEDVRYRVTREIRENPLLCIGLALGVGALIGAIGGRASAPSPSSRRHHWLADVASDLTDRAHEVAHEVGDRALRAGRHANRGLHQAAHRATEALPDVHLDHLVKRGKSWLRSALS